MNILDENIAGPQREQLRAWGIAVRHIGYDFWQQGVQDEAIIPLLHQLHRPTFFTADRDFYQRSWCHAGYCLVHLLIPRPRTAEYVRKVLRHPQFNTIARRMGLIIQVRPSGLNVLQLHAEREMTVLWGK
jgi:hypothetical protein